MRHAGSTNGGRGSCDAVNEVRINNREIVSSVSIHLKLIHYDISGIDFRRQAHTLSYEKSSIRATFLYATLDLLTYTNNKNDEEI